MRRLEVASIVTVVVFYMRWNMFFSLFFAVLIVIAIYALICERERIMPEYDHKIIQIKE